MKPVMYANLHNHTTHSDGVFTPEELVRVAKDEGYSVIAAADHDTVTANPEVKAAAEKMGMESIFACEFYALCPRYNEYFRDYHLVGFDFDPEYPAMKEYLRKRSDDMASKTEFLFERAMQMDKLPKGITWQEVVDYNKGITWLCNDHVFMAMEAKGIVTAKEWPHYFSTCFGAKSGIFVPPKHPILEIEDLIALIHEAGGLAVVAHPAYPAPQISTIPELVKCGLDGIEVWHSTIMSQHFEKETLRLALEYGLYISGGADHEGLCGGQYKFFDKPEETIYWLDPMAAGTTKEFYEEIKNRKLMTGRDDIIKEYMKEYPDTEIPIIKI